MDQHRFIHFQKKQDGRQNHCDIIIYDDLSHFYFFGNALLYCLDYKRPHEIMKIKIPSDQKKKENFGHGIYLREDTVKNLIVDRVKEDRQGFSNFQNWFNRYLASCKGIYSLESMDKDPCPQSTT